MAERLNPNWDEVVNQSVSDLSFIEFCRAIHMIDQLGAEIDDVVEKLGSKKDVDEIAGHLDEWITYWNKLIKYWGRFGTGRDEEEDLLRSMNHRPGSNDIRDNYQL